MIKFCENFSLGFLLNQYQTYQDNLCGVYLALSSLFESGVIQNSVTCIKQSTPSQDHITCLGWLTSFPRALSNAVLNHRAEEEVKEYVHLEEGVHPSSAIDHSDLYGTQPETFPLYCGSKAS